MVRMEANSKKSADLKAYFLFTQFLEPLLDLLRFFKNRMVTGVSKVTLGKIKNRPGFTIIELMFVIGIVGIVTTIAIPTAITWRNNAQFNGSVNTLAGDLAVAKQTAIRNNAIVVTVFTNLGYTIFIDSTPNDTQDADEPALRTRTLPNGVVIDLGASTFAGNLTRFRGTGMCTNVGLVVISQGANQNSVAVNRLGRISII